MSAPTASVRWTKAISVRMWTAPKRTGKPDQGEPNFGILDKDESDQLGLTGFLISSVHTYDLNNDERNWQALSSLPAPHGGELVGVNLANHFSSYLFPLAGTEHL